MYVYIYCIYNLKHLYGKKVPRKRPQGPEGGRGIALLFLTTALEGVGGQLYPRERSGTHCTGGWMGPRGGLDVCEKSRPRRHSIPGLSSP
jgi:hypothetical protein